MPSLTPSNEVDAKRVVALYCTALYCTVATIPAAIGSFSSILAMLQTAVKKSEPWRCHPLYSGKDTCGRKIGSNIPIGVCNFGCIVCSTGSDNPRIDSRELPTDTHRSFAKLNEPGGVATEDPARLVAIALSARASTEIEYAMRLFVMIHLSLD